MSRLNRWMAARGMVAEALWRRVAAGIVLGLTVVGVDHVLRMGS